MKINYDNNTGLIPAIIQDFKTTKVLMLGYMNEEAYEKTRIDKKVTFYSRSKGRLWQKGESSGNYLELVNMEIDCDNDTLLIQANPHGPVCHKGDDTCWGKENKKDQSFLGELESIIDERFNSRNEGSYTASLFEQGINRIAQKVGEEAFEVVIEAKDENDDRLIEESADLLYHLLVLIRFKGRSLNDVINVLEKRHTSPPV